MKITIQNNLCTNTMDILSALGDLRPTTCDQKNNSRSLRNMSIGKYIII